MQCNTFDLSPIESIANKTIKKFQPCCWVNRVDQTRRNPVLPETGFLSSTTLLR